MGNLTQDKARILVVDDEESILKVFEDILCPASGMEDLEKRFQDLDHKIFGGHSDPGIRPSYELSLRRNGDDAVKAVRMALEYERPFSVAFLDVRMPPGPDGIVTAEGIRALDPHINIVIVTAYSDVDPQLIARKVPPADKLFYARKPLHHLEIRQFAMALCSRWRAEKKLKNINKELESQVEERTSNLKRLNRQLQIDLSIRKQAQAALKDTREELEKRIEERTAELINSNEKLREILDLQKNEAERMHHQAYHDSLTGLPNKALFIDRLNQALAHAERNEYSLAVIVLDLDRFKKVNNSLGYEAGDWLLKQVPTRIEKCLRQSDTVARAAGDEFLILVTDIKDDTAPAIIVDKIVQAVNDVYVYESYDLRLTSSAGISLFPGNPGAQPPTAEMLIHLASGAMKNVKENGGNGFLFHDEKLSRQSFEVFKMESNLRRALDNDELLLHFHPIQEVETGKIQGLEALLRWKNREEVYTPPEDFFPFAEETGIIASICHWVIEEISAGYSRLQKSFGKPLTISINLAASQFRNTDLTQRLSGFLERTKLKPEFLQIEFREEVLIKNPDKISRILESIKMMGIGLCLDDFGSGLASLSSLSVFPLDTIKIDNRLIAAMMREKKERALVESIINLGHLLDLTVIAVGVETEEQLSLLQDFGCDGFQGFLQYIPVPAGEMVELFTELNKNRT